MPKHEWSLYAWPDEARPYSPERHEIAHELKRLPERRVELQRAAALLPVGVLRAEAAKLEECKAKLYAAKRRLEAAHWVESTNNWTPHLSAIAAIMREPRDGNAADANALARGYFIMNERSWAESSLPPRWYWKRPTGFPNGRPRTNRGKSAPILPGSRRSAVRPSSGKLPKIDAEIARFTAELERIRDEEKAKIRAQAEADERAADEAADV
jgi:hypothetical protein